MALFSRKKVTVEGPHAEQAHAILHQEGTSHHGFADFNGMNFMEYDGMIVDRGSNKVTISLGDNEDVERVKTILRQRNPSWRVS